MAVRPRAPVAADRRWRCGPSRSARCVPLRHPPAVVPEEPQAARRRAGARRAADAREACRAAGVTEQRAAGYARALATLARSGMIDGGRGHASAEAPSAGRLVDQFEPGLDAPICLTWELTYACNLACVHCLSSSGRRDPRELTTAECKAVIDELERMQVFYVNIGGGEPTVRRDFWELVDYATAHHVGVKFSTNGVRITPRAPRRLAASDYVDVQISLDGATAEVNDARPRRRARSPPRSGDGAPARRGLRELQDLGRRHARERRRSSTTFKAHRRPLRRAAAADAAAAVRPRRGRLGRAASRPRRSSAQLYDWLLAHGEKVLTGDSFFHLAAYGEALPGLNLCGAGRVVCLIDPVGDVYACPFAIHDDVPAPATCASPAASRRLARVGAVPGPARAADRRRVRVVLAVRLVPRRLHGGEVLHRAAARRARTPSACSGTASRCARRARAAASRRAQRPTTRAGCPRVRPRLRREPARGLEVDAGLMAGWFEIGRRGAAAGEAHACPSSVYRRSGPGSERGLDARRTTSTAFGELGFAPHVAGLPAERDLSTTVMGQAISLPVIISPTGVQAVHPDGEVAVARAAAARGTAMGLSSFASKPVEEVVAANPQTFFQLYWAGSREQILARVERAGRPAP